MFTAHPHYCTGGVPLGNLVIFPALRRMLLGCIVKLGLARQRGRDMAHSFPEIIAALEDLNGRGGRQGRSAI